MKNHLTIFILLFALFSCSKDKKKSCFKTLDIAIVTNSPVTVGWPLNMETANHTTFKYIWKGPNNWTFTANPFSNWQGTVIKDSASMADAGYYVVEIYDEDCMVKRATAYVEVVEAPDPPCTIPFNQSTTNFPGIGGVNYTTINGIQSSISYKVEAHASDQSLIFYFDRGMRPTPGVYKSKNANITYERDEAAVYIKKGNLNYYCQPGQEVYVNEFSGKLYLSFCSANFTSPNTTDVIVVSARIELD